MIGAWFADNWFNILSAAGIIASLLFTAFSLRSEAETRRIANLLTLTENHRKLWSKVVDDPKLGRIFDARADLKTCPVTLEERLFVGMIIQHLHAGYQAIRRKLYIELSGFSKDVREFFRLPIPHFVWTDLKGFQNEDFVAFIEKCLTEADEPAK